MRTNSTGARLTKKSIAHSSSSMGHAEIRLGGVWAKGKGTGRPANRLKGRMRVLRVLKLVSSLPAQCPRG